MVQAQGFCPPYSALRYLPASLLAAQMSLVKEILSDHLTSGVGFSITYLPHRDSHLLESYVFRLYSVLPLKGHISS